jgi:GTP cyclohydrolase I
MPLTPTESAIETFIEALLIKMVPPEEQTRLKPHIERTHKRVAKMFEEELLAGYKQSPKSILKAAFEEDGYDEIVSVRAIPFYSLCAHHLLPFFGRAHVAYLPAGKVVGLSKLARLVDCFARRFQIQERMTEEIAHALMDNLKCKAAGVVLDAEHLCMACRGVEKSSTITTTSVMLGSFRDEPETRAEVMALLRGK